MKIDCEQIAYRNQIRYNEEKRGGTIYGKNSKCICTSTKSVVVLISTRLLQLPEVKEKAEQVLDRLGIPMSNAVGMFLRQIVLQRGIPFEMKLPDYEEPVAYGSLTKEQFNTEIEKGMEDIKAGRVYSADDVEAEIKREFGI